MDENDELSNQERRDKLKEQLLKDIEIIDIYNHDNVVDVIFCRLKYDMFGLKADNYVIIYYPDEDGYCNFDYYISGDEIIIEYLMKQDVNNKELSYNLWKQKKDLYNGIEVEEIDCWSKRLSFEEIF